MKGQQLFHSFLPGVTAAVLTTQPGWAQTVNVGEVRLFADPHVSTSTYSGNVVANNTNTQLPTFTPTSTTTESLEPLSSSSIGVVVTGKTGLPIKQISRNAQSVVFSLTPTTVSANPTMGIGKQGVQGEIKVGGVGGIGGAGGVTSSLASLASPAYLALSPSFVQQLYANQKNPQTQLPTVSEMPAMSAGSAKLLQAQQLCVQGNKDGGKRSAYVPLLTGGLQEISVSQACSPQNITSGNLVAQANTPTPNVRATPAPTNLAPTTPVTPGQVPTTPAPGSPINPKVPTTTPPTPTNSTPIIPTTKPTNAGFSVQVPEYLNSNPNPLQFPTKPEEVRLQGTQPITLAQALELARRNNRDLQVALLTLERTKYSVRQAQAALLPSASLSTQFDRTRSNQQTTDANGNLINSPAVSEFSGTAQVNYQLYTSGLRNANIGAAEEQLRYYELDVERISEQTRLTVTTDYYNLQSADENVRIYQAAVLNYQASLRDALALERAGVGTRFDVLQAQVNLANGQQQLTTAIAQQQISRRTFAQAVGLSQTVNVSAADPVELAGLWNLSLEDSIVLAFQNRPELQQYIAQRNTSEQQRRAALAQLGPQISLFGNYNLQEPFDQKGPLNQNVGLNDGYSLGVQATLTLYDGGAQRASADQQKINIRIYNTQFATQRDTIRLQVEQAFFNLQSSLQNVQTSTVALGEAREALRLARLRFQAGVGTQTDVITQEAALTQAEGNRVSAILSYNTYLAQLQQAVTTRGLR